MTDKQLKKENFFLRRQEGTLYMFSYTIGLCLLWELSSFWDNISMGPAPARMQISQWLLGYWVANTM